MNILTVAEGAALNLKSYYEVVNCPSCNHLYMHNCMLTHFHTEALCPITNVQALRYPLL